MSECCRQPWSRRLANSPFVFLARGDALDVFAAIHQREEGAKNTCLNFVGHRETAGRHAHKLLATPGDLPHELYVPIVAGIPKRGFAAHLGAFLLDEQSEVQDTHTVRSQSGGHRRLASL